MQRQGGRAVRGRRGSRRLTKARKDQLAITDVREFGVATGWTAVNGLPGAAVGSKSQLFCRFMDTEPAKRGVALFDLDQTLVPWDTQLLFCNWVLRHEPIRRLFLLILLPFLPLSLVLGSEGMKRVFLSFLWAFPSAAVEVGLLTRGRGSLRSFQLPP